MIIADEPMSALDVSVQAAISELLMNLQRESRTTMVFISHDLSVVRYLADRVVVMYLGHIVEMGATEQIFSPPFHPYTEALLSAIPIADPTVKKRHVVLEGEIPSALSPPPGCPFQTRCGAQARMSRRTCASARFRRCGASPTATRSSATCRSRRSSAWSRCFRESLRSVIVEERSDEAIQGPHGCGGADGLLRFARNDGASTMSWSDR